MKHHIGVRVCLPGVSAWSARSTARVLLLIGAMLLTAGFLSACGGGGGGGNTGSNTTPPASAATASLSFNAIKTFRFDWTDVPDATHYRLLENPDGNSGFSQVGGDIPQGQQGVDHVVPLYQRINASYILQSCNSDGCTDGAAMFVSGTLQSAIGYVKASNTGMGDLFGYAISLSGDGNTLAIGAPSEDSAATGVDANQNDNIALSAGAVYVFNLVGSSWSQQAYLKASNTDAGDGFGIAVSLSDDGNTLAISAPSEDSAATGVDGDSSDNTADFAGAVYVFTRTGSTWQQQAYLKASNTEAFDAFGKAVELSGDGNTLAVGADEERSAAIGIGGDQKDNTAANAGAVYVFARTGSTWQQEAYVKASNTDAGDRFGQALSLSSDGNTLAVGAYAEDSFANGIDGNQADNQAADAGAVYVFSRSGTVWQQQAYVKASNTDAGDLFGHAVSLSSDGDTLAVSARSEDSMATGVAGDQNDNSVSGAGAVYVFSRKGSTWQQQAYLKASNTGSLDRFGWAVSVSGDGNTLAVGAIREDSAASGIGGDQADNTQGSSGAVYIYKRIGAIWSQQAYVKASNTDGGDWFGFAVSLSSDGKTLAVGAENEQSNATGINGDQADNTASNSGAVYLY